MAVLSVASTAAGAELPSILRRATDLSPERVDAFKRALREFGGDWTGKSSFDLGLQLVARYDAPPPVILPARPGEQDDIVVPLGGASLDPLRDEVFLYEGREDDLEDAAKKWMARRLKGSDAAADSRGHGLAPKLAWDDGPIVGFRKGPVSVTAGAHQQRLRFTHRLRSRPGWAMRVSVGTEDGDQRVAFSIGRSLLRSAAR